MNKCINCAYFLNCESADEKINECERYIKRDDEQETN